MTAHCDGDASRSLERVDSAWFELLSVAGDPLGAVDSVGVFALWIAISVGVLGLTRETGNGGGSSGNTDDGTPTGDVDGNDPLEALLEAIDTLEEGTYDIAVPTERADEYGLLGDRLEGLADSLRTRSADLERYRGYTDDLVDAVDDVFILLEPDGTIRRWNESLVASTSYTYEDVTSMNAFEFFGSDERTRVETAVETALETGHARIETDAVGVDGTVVPYEFVLSRVEDPDGTVLLAAVGRDVSDRNAHRQRLRERERQLSTLMHNIPGMVYRCRNEPTWPMEFVSQGCQELTGYRPDQLVDGSVVWADDVLVTDNSVLWEHVQGSLETRKPFQVTYEAETADGRRRWFKEQGRGVFDDAGTLEALEGVIIDVTDRVESERELERTSELLQQTQRVASVGGWEIDVHGGEPYDVLLTDETFRIRGLEPADSIPLEQGIEWYHPDDRHRVREAVYRAIEDGVSYDLEARLHTERGDQRWVRVIGDPVREDGEIVMLRGSLQDITERKERERTLTRTREMLEQSQHIADVGGWVIELEDGEPSVCQWTEKAAEIFGLEPEGSLEFDESIALIHPDDRAQVRTAFERTAATGDPHDLEVRIGTDTGQVRWIRTIGKRYTDDGEPSHLQGSIQDITTRKERELALQSLHETTRELLQVDSIPAAASLITETADGVLDVSGSCVYAFDSETNTLDPIASSGGFSGYCDGDVSIGAGDGDSVLWETFLTGTQTVFDGAEVTSQSPVFGTRVEAGLVVPIGNHGVFVVAHDDVIDHETRRLAETLVATMEAAFDRLESEADLRTRDAELEAQNRRLSRQIQINDIIRTVDQSLIGASSQADIERTVCDRLSESEHVELAWIGGLNVAETVVEPRAWAGQPNEYLDAVSLETDVDEPELAVATALTETPAVVSNVADDLRTPWRKAALTHDLSSCLAVPLRVDEYTYGVLAVYTDEPGAFGDLERTVFSELGETIANAITAVEARSALSAESHLELTLHIDGTDDVLARLAADANCQVTYEGMGRHSSDEVHLFVITEGASAAAVTAILDDLVTVVGYRRIGGGETASSDESEPERCHFEITVSGTPLASRLTRHGGSPQSIRATASGIDAVVDLPTTADVREFVDTLGETYDHVELQARQHVDRAMHTRAQVVTELFNDLTERQLEVLRTAYFAGFFDWPRESTGQDIADMLEVSQPTINRHLRFAQQRLLTQLFERDGVGTGGSRS
ncbi:PAS domain S-box protein [Natronosalvus vescus]|uniref:PAS domain S-box protein n=1 Tax=Natronosalvus vescus TaxID=2953881 RepID=UPI002090E63A|nr:PAS domain S-box protein [Natronosalvus vescus]